MESKIKLVKWILIICVTQWLFVSEAYADRMYRYKDENGKVVVGSTLPPKFAQKGYEILNKQNIVIEVVQPRKTDEQLAAEEAERKRLEAIAEQKRQQQQLDLILINSYTDISDVERARDNELSTRDRDIMFLRQNIRRLTRLLEDAQTRAARDERLGQELSAKLLKEIDDLKGRIDREKAQIEKIKLNKVEVVNRFNDSITRFAELKAAERIKAYRDETEEDRKKDKSIYQCKGINTCDLVWNKSLRFASEYSTTELAWANETTVMMRKPREDTDVSIVVTRVNNSRGNAASIVLEVRCNKSIKGEELCRSAKVKEIHETFGSYLQLPSSKL
ncbi:MAG: DUF4124 domain-containing protein [Gammaproteobacteria bacterium]|nr:DUF4124 domain-containing protein [Gammaproteobacteria bacterium]NNJ73431.1 DUF4124 domain-containing protein [Enterobacterales bacterium]